MSAPSKILPLLTSREARRTTTERPTNVLSATVPPVCSSAADSADLARLPPLPICDRAAVPPFLRAGKIMVRLRARTCAPPELSPPLASLTSPGAATEYSPRVPTTIAPPKFFFTPGTAPTRSQATAPQHRRTQPKREPHARARSTPHVAHVAVAGNLRPESVLRAAHAVYTAVESNRRPLNFIFASRAIVRRQPKREPHENGPGQGVVTSAPGRRGGRPGGSRSLPASQGRYAGIRRLNIGQLSPSSCGAQFLAKRSPFFPCCRNVAKVEGPR